MNPRRNSMAEVASSAINVNNLEDGKYKVICLVL